MKNRCKNLFTQTSRKVLGSFIFVLFVVGIFAVAFAVKQAKASGGEANAPSGGLSSSLISPSGNPQSPDAIWQFVEESTIVSSGQRQTIPQVYRTAQVNEEALRQLLAKAPQEFDATTKSNALVLSLPLPDGTFGTF